MRYSFNVRARVFTVAAGASIVASAILAAAGLEAQDFDHVEVQLIAKGLHFAEGPVWSYEGFLLYSDVPVDRLHKWTPGTGDAEAGTEPGGRWTYAERAFDTDAVHTCEFRQRRVTRTDKKGKTDVLAARFEGKQFNAPNDIVVRRDGHVYFTDPAFGSQQDTKELDFYGVYHIAPKGEIEAIGRWKTRVPLGLRSLRTGAHCMFPIPTSEQ